MAFTEMYGFETRDGQQARVDLSQIRSVLPSGSASGYVKAVLDGGNSVTIKGTVDGVYDLIVHYCGKRTEGTAPRVRVSGVGTGVGRTPDVPQVNAVPMRVESSDGRYVGTMFSGPATGKGMRYEKPQYTESDVAVREIAQLVGLSCPVSNPREVTEAVNKMQHEHHARIRELRESSKESDESIALRDIAKALGFIGPPDSPQTVVKAVKEAQSEQGAWMLNLANALGLPSGKDKTAILSRAWAVGGQQHQS